MEKKALPIIAKIHQKSNIWPDMVTFNLKYGRVLK
jgi:hypothetical protein